MPFIMVKNIIIASALALLGLGAQAQQKLPKGTSLSVVMTNDVSSRKNSPEAQAVVASDVIVNQKVMIKGGTPVSVVTEKERARGVGRPGSIRLTFATTQAVDGQTVYLYGGQISREGKSKKGKALGLGLGLGIGLFCPPLFAIMAMKGEQAEVPANTVAAGVFVANDYNIEVK